MISLRHRLAMGITTIAFGLGTLAAHIPEARADEVSPTGKGIVGTALLGGELVMIIGGIAGVKSPWYYVIGGGLAAIGGGVGGYFIEQAVADGKGGDGHIPVYLLGGGLLGIIPALVLTLNATRYQPPAGAKEDKAPTNTHDADPGKVGGSVVGGSSTDTGTTPAPAPAPSGGGSGGSSGGGTTTPPPPQSLLDVHQGTFRMGVPVPQLRNLYTMAERKELGVGDGYELRMPVVRVSF